MAFLGQPECPPYDQSGSFPGPRELDTFPLQFTGRPNTVGIRRNTAGQKLKSAVQIKIGMFARFRATIRPRQT